MDNTNNFNRKYTLTIYAITTILLFADQNLLSPNLSAAADEFHFNDMQRDEKLGGDIAIAFFVLGAPASLIVGCAADVDTVSRSRLFGLTVLIGEGACLATYFTSSYYGLYVTRALTGFSVGGALPMLSSVLADWYLPEDRSSVMAMVGIGSGIGIALGQTVSGFLGPLYGWRSPFLVISVPAIIMALLLIGTVVDPERGGIDRILIEQQEQEKLQNDLGAEQRIPYNDNPQEILVVEQLQEVSINSALSGTVPLRRGEDHHRQETSEGLESFEINSNTKGRVDENSACKQLARKIYKCFASTVCAQHLATTRELLTTPSVLLSLMQGAPGCVPWGIVNTYLNDYLSENCGLSVQAATVVILFFGVGVFLGMIIGGVCGRYLYKIDPRYPCLLSGSAAVLGCIPLWVLINSTHATSTNESSLIKAVLRTAPVAVLAGLGSGVTGPIVKASLQNVTVPHSRGQAFALLNTFDDFGRGIGPYFVAILIEHFDSRKEAFNVGVFGWVLCGILNACLFLTVRRDEEKARGIIYRKYTTIYHRNENEKRHSFEEKGSMVA